MYKLIATDLDGTLLRPDKTMSEKTVQTIEKLIENGVYFVASTGRTHRELPKELERIKGMQFAITVNGGALYSYTENRYVYEITLEKCLALRIMEFLDRFPVYGTCVINGRRYMPSDEDDVSNPEIEKVAMKGILSNTTFCKDVKAKIKELPYDVQKILAYFTDPSVKEELTNGLKEAFPEVTVSSSGPYNVEVNARGVDKGTALRKLCEYLQIDVADTMAFGDAGNDIPLLDAAGLAVVMSNGTDETKQHADEIADSCENDGVRKTIEKHFTW
ncbi:MAG: HAD family hydrolase [Erysipelotrichaceae bacterium]|nr:HAD family hydrolase [Erysipelotrichaceae bacterium]